MRHGGIALVVSLLLLAPAAAVVRADPPAAPAAPAKPDTFVMVSVRVIEATPRAARSLRLLGTTRRPGDLATFDPAALGRRIECWTKAGHVTAISAPRLMTIPGQTGTVTIGEYISYLEDYDVEISVASNSANPVIQTIFEGLNFVCTPTLVPGGVSLDAELALSDVSDPIKEVETTLASSTTKVRLQVPEVHIRRAHGQFVLPPGRAALLADLPPVITAPNGRLLMAWIEAHAVANPER